MAVDQTSNWLMVDPWEAIQKDYMPTALVLEHVEHEINVLLGGVEVTEGVRRPVRVCLLAGADLIQTMSTPGVWSDKDLNIILGRYGAFIVERTGTDIGNALSNLQPYKDNVFVIQVGFTRNHQAISCAELECVTASHPKRRQQHQDQIVSP
jgi:nicotinamide mononucleotide adenylyltransferase